MKTSRIFMTSLVIMIFNSFVFTLHAQNCEPAWGPDSLETRKKVSLYSEFFEQGDNASSTEAATRHFNDALPHWRYVFYNAPGARQSTFVDGAKMFKHYIKQEKDEAKKAALVDTLLLIYDQRLKCFGEDCEVIGRKAIEMLNYTDDAEGTYTTFKKSIDMCGAESKYFLLYPYAIAAIRAYNKDIIDEGKLLSIYSQLSDIAATNIKQGGKYADRYKSAQEKVDEVISKTGILDCDNLKSIYEKQYAENPDDPDLLTKIYTQMKAALCANEDLFMEVTEKLMKTDPDAEKARIIAMVSSNKKNYDKALTYYKKAIDMEDDPETIAEYNMRIAEIYYDKNDFPSARTYALKAAGQKSNWGEPYLLIGDLYRGSGKKCGPGTGWDSQVVTWPAIDMYTKAKTIDPSVAAEAGRKIADSKQYMPAKSECFFHGLSDGDTFEVECWINETTTVRCKSE